MFYHNREVEEKWKRDAPKREEEQRRKYEALTYEQKELVRLFDGFSMSFEKDGEERGFHVRFDFDSKKLKVLSYGFGLFESESPYRDALYREMRERAKGSCVSIHSYWYWNMENE